MSKTIKIRHWEDWKELCIEQKVLTRNITKIRMKAFADRRIKIFDKIMLKYPEGVTKNNLEEIRKAVLKEEKKLIHKED